MTITELKARYKELNPEGYFFSPETNRVWGSSVEKVHEHASGNIFFITKENIIRNDIYFIFGAVSNNL